MSEIIKSIIVGIVQGLTEFLPVSSSGHIVIAQEVLNIKFDEEENLLFAIVLHCATALSTMVIFRKDIAQIFKGLFQFKKNEEWEFAIKVVLSMIPAAIVGVALKDTLEAIFSNLFIVGCMLLVTASLLLFADKAKGDGRAITFKDATIIGVAQGFAALFPGLSRSGTTISTSIILGNDKGKAARFSFLMVLPLIIGATAKMFLDAKDAGGLTLGGINTEALIAGFIAAFVSGMVACKWMIELVKKAKLTYFSIYCFVMGTCVILYSLFMK